MALIKCPECGENISDKANTCPHCGYTLKKKESSGCFTAFLWIIAIIIGLVVINTIYTDITSKKTEGNIGSGFKHDKIMAYNYAENFVKKQLKSPRTAKFPSVSEKITHVHEQNYNEYKIDSWVDSQNSFGALVRTRFICTIIFDGKNVKCKDLKFY